MQFLTLLIVCAIVAFRNWNPTEKQKQRWMKRQAKWDRKIGNLQKKMGISEVWTEIKSK